MRFGRDGNGAVVYVHTNTLPEWVPIAGEGEVIDTWSDGMRQVLEAVRDRREWTTAEIVADPQVDLSERQVRAHLTRLYEDGYLDRETEGCGFVWRDDGLHRVSEHGEVDLEPVDVDALDDAESAEVARSSYYTWDFRTLGADTDGAAPLEAPRGEPASVAAANGGDRPPDDPD
jgi:DNA-binding transcriptional ArsR family regulator